MAAFEPEEALLSIDVDRAEGCHVITLGGELDVASVSPLRRLLDELIIDGGAHLVIDLSGLGFLDSSGLGVLVRAHQKSRVLRERVGIVTGTGPAQRLFAITGLNHVLRTFDTVDEARAGLDGGLGERMLRSPSRSFGSTS